MKDAKAVMRHACGLFLCLILTGCVTAPYAITPLPATDEVPPGAEVKNVPFFPQERHQCGPAALASMLGWAGMAIMPDTLATQVYLPGKQGSMQAELMAATRRNDRIPYQIPPRMESLLAEIADGHPVMVLQNLGLAWLPRWHYAVVIGYDIEKQKLTLHSGVEARKEMPLQLFEKTWSRANHWAMVVMPPDRLPATADERGYLLAISELERIGSWNVSLVAYEGALRQWPESEYAMLGLANSHYRLGQMDAAEKQYRKGLEIHPMSAVFHNNLAQLLLEQGRLSEAEAAARMAVKLGGNLQDSYRKTLENILKKMPYQ